MSEVSVIDRLLLELEGAVGDLDARIEFLSDRVSVVLGPEVTEPMSDALVDSEVVETSVLAQRIESSTIRMRNIDDRLRRLVGRVEL